MAKLLQLIEKLCAQYGGSVDRDLELFPQFRSDVDPMSDSSSFRRMLKDVSCHSVCVFREMSWEEEAVFVNTGRDLAADKVPGSLGLFGGQTPIGAKRVLR